MQFRSFSGLALVGGLALTLACAAEQEGGEAAMDHAMPDTTATALWAHMEESGYTDWATWPGKGELYVGTEPHGMLLTTYVNALALDAITNKAGAMSAGAIVVKENYMPDSTRRYGGGVGAGRRVPGVPLPGSQQRLSLHGLAEPVVGVTPRDRRGSRAPPAVSGSRGRSTHRRARSASRPADSS